MTPSVTMECVEEQQSSPRAGDIMRMKIVLKDNLGKNKDSRIVNIDRAVAEFSDIKTTVVQNFPELENEEFVLGWIDEERDFITMESDEELKAALAEVKGGMLKIHVKQTQNMKKVDGKCQKIQLPRQYFDNLLATRQKISGQGGVVLHNQNLERMIELIRKHPGVLFVGGDLKEKLGANGGNTEQMQVAKKNAQKEGSEVSGKPIVNRIIPPQKAIALLKGMKENNDEDSKMLSFLFLPINAGQKKQHCHVVGTWEDSKMICVAFKRRGDGGQEPGTDGGEKKMEKNQKLGNRAERSNTKLTKGEKTKKQSGSGSSTNKCMVPRKRMKMIASKMFLKVDVINGFANISI
eukprot:TRINITY_DN8649_c0_g1_i10.p1 TRINITY_DN8649_c0_g1~~TRINITY_DN8649_c0_g1_i10.p1  ORF type:complete len:350 (+),score=130.29 TRINITY_DN8649_c0_g1_i10:18-1067(+)